jgi:hypothetical protein
VSLGSQVHLRLWLLSSEHKGVAVIPVHAGELGEELRLLAWVNRETSGSLPRSEHSQTVALLQLQERIGELLPGDEKGKITA